VGSWKAPLPLMCQSVNQVVHADAETECGELFWVFGPPESVCGTVTRSTRLEVFLGSMGSITSRKPKQSLDITSRRNETVDLPAVSAYGFVPADSESVVQTDTTTATPTGLAPSRGPHSRETWSGRGRADTALCTLQLLAHVIGSDSALDSSPFSRPYYGNPC
jgi:hypothetical protein